MFRSSSARTSVQWSTMLFALLCSTIARAGECVDYAALNPPDAHVIGTLSTAPETPAGLTVVGSRVYLAKKQWGLGVVDVANPAAPVPRATVDTPGAALRVEVSGGYAFVADYTGDLQVASLADPDAPVLVASMSKPGYALDIAVQGSYAYLVDGFNVVDISNPLAPTIVGFTTTLLGAREVEVSGRWGYVADSSRGLVVIDILNPQQPVDVAAMALPRPPRGIRLDGSIAYLRDDVNRVWVADVSNPYAPSLITALPAVTGSVEVADVLGVSGVVYEGVAGAPLHVWNMADPGSPSLIGLASPPGHVGQAVFAGGRIYIADQSAGLLIVRPHCNPTDASLNPEVALGTLRLSIRPNPMQATATIAGALPSTGSGAIRIFDVAGRVIRVLYPARLGNTFELPWDGVDGTGTRVAPGLYLVRVDRQHAPVGRVIVLR